MLNTNHKRILRNTGILYLRMLLAMGVGLYTSRVLLQVLGVDDFGIYYVVVGFVALLGFMQGAMVSATQRYFAFDLGEHQGSNLCNLFNTSLQIHALLAIAILLLAETLGYWFVSTQLTIPADRLQAALIAYHLSVIAFMVSVMTVPLSAILMAHERMDLFSMLSMADILLKLIAVLVLPFLSYDKLITYAALLLIISLSNLLAHYIITKVVFPAVRLQWRWHKTDFHNMLGFTAWNTCGNLAATLAEQGNNVLLNVFFGPAVNAGRSIATQANGALNQFVTNVQAAVNPQIIKSYASDNKADMHQFVLKSAKYNFFILLILAMPVLMNTETILNIWLQHPPPYAVIFLQLAIISSLIHSLSGPLMTAAQATGQIRIYHTVVGGILLLNVPMNYFLLLNGLPPETVLMTAIALATLALAARLKIITALIHLPISSFLNSVLRPVVAVTLTTSIIANLVTINTNTTISTLAINTLSVTLVCIIVIWYLGLAEKEKKNIYHILKLVKTRIF
ncbi:lipopolysaccharide biosynthesis protein [Alcaligenes endophyticus]|uniref:Oligosaccharide flippase family protein n=1 Tax=Alcaligenes endophyticus TaxID=1929088 RepID=A0ABT8EFT4_9BURK|nr:oligosaccharide flippase family protein [Alcaligenes endophyticus]MCX5590206.1 oligosaccharide flippase family protein [Alcaligenes endophyticus]MDN4120131.1 oligosaccharide flippase family protein [Alcaligenes endophyticus]